MKTIKKLILLSLSLFLFMSCDIIEDRGFDPTIMPEETSKGANTFGCLIDGWIYAAGRFSKKWNIEKENYSPHLFLYDSLDNIMEVSVIIKPDYYIYFTIIDPEENKETFYTDFYLEDEEMEDGKVFITRFDKTNKIISGRFEGGRITHGRFDVNYVVKE